MPTAPDPHAIAVLILACIALILFTREEIPLESSSLMVLVLLTVGFEIFPYQGDTGRLHAADFFAGFGHEALVAVCGLMIVGHGLVRTGALEPVGRILAKAWSISPQLSLLMTLFFAGILSAVINNTPIVVLLLPILVSVSLRTQTPASSVLMPMGFATLVGGMTTTIGTSTNLLVVSIAADLGLERFQMFDFFLPAAAAGGVGALYLWQIAPRLLPLRQATMSDTSPRIFSAQLNITEESFAAGKPLAEILQKTDGQMRVSQIRRGDSNFIAPLPDVEVRAGDHLLVNDTPTQLKEYEQLLGAHLYSGDLAVDDEHPLINEDQQLAEIVITRGSPLLGTTLNDTWFSHRYQMVTLAIHRAGKVMKPEHYKLGDILLHIGDVLLVQGNREQLAEIKQSGQVLVLDATSDLPHSSKANLSLAIMGGVIVAAAMGVLPIEISALLGALLMILSGCIGWRDVGQALSTQVILIVVASLALGIALMQTGATDYLAQLFLVAVGNASPAVVLSSLMLLMAFLTNVVSNNAAAVIGTPIGISVAQSLNLPPEAFVLAVLFGANMSYATPMAYKTNLLVMNAGGYTFSDFVRIGVPLILIMWLTLSLLLPAMYGF
ncbi:MAG: SLC13 family permease [Candidatus Sedimenticola sp. (ex Thyasira tokunagai)]